MTASPAAQAVQIYAADFGAVVTGGPKTLPAQTTGHLFTVSGGRVLVTSLVGVVSTVIQAQACTVSVGNTPSGGSGAGTSVATASSSVSGVAVGSTLYVRPFSSGSAQALLFTGASGVAPGPGVQVASGGICLVPAGTVDWVTSATNTGAVVWSLSYVPYDAGATVTAL